MPLLRSLEVIREQTPHKNLAKVLEDVHGRVQEGKALLLKSLEAQKKDAEADKLRQILGDK